MKKLRLIKDRTEHEASDQDLRGIGNDPVLKSDYPWVFLTINKNSQVVIEAAKVFELSIKTGQQKDQIHLFKHGPRQSHKEKSLVLFTAALLILSKEPSAKMMLGQLNTMSHKIHGKADLELHEEMSPDFAHWEMKEGLHLPEQFMLYLKQAGIPVHKNLVTHNDIHDLTSVPTATETKHRKLG